MQKAVTLKGTNDGWRLIVNEQASYQEIKEELATLVNNIREEKNKENNYQLKILTGNRLLDEEQLQQMIALIEDETQFQVSGVVSDVIRKDTAEAFASQVGVELAVRNVRNGQILESEKDILLIGKVFPGGVVRSAGHIVVIGEMNGTIQAGCNGDEEAVVINNFTNDAQVRIADHIEVIEPEENSEGYQVLLVNDMYVMERISPRLLKERRPDIVKETGGLEEWLEQL